MTHKEPTEHQNPYAPTSANLVYPDSISFDGIVNEENYRQLLPKKEPVFFLSLAFLLIAVALPILVGASFLAIFIEGKVEMIMGSVGMTLLTMVALGFCLRMASTLSRARSYLKKFPDLVGSMKGTFSAKGLILDDLEKIHWIPWVQLSHLVISNVGVRVPLGDDPRRFLALAAHLFDSYRPTELEHMQFRNGIAQTTFEQLAIDSAAVFQSEVGSANYFSGMMHQPVSWSAWVILLIGPSALCTLIAILSIQGQWSWFYIGLIFVFMITVLPSLRSIFQLIRRRSLVTVMCWGWLSDAELIYGSGVHVMMIQLALLTHIGRDSEKLQFVLASGKSLYLFRSLFLEPSHFDKVSASFDRLKQ